MVQVKAIAGIFIGRSALRRIASRFSSRGCAVNARLHEDPAAAWQERMIPRLHSRAR
jgi:hypothetical protein